MTDKTKTPVKKPTGAKPPPSSATPARPAAPLAPAGHKPAVRPLAAKRRARGNLQREIVLPAVLGGIVLALAAAFVYGLAMPKSPWAFDRPEAQLPSLQPHHTLQ